MEKRSFWSKEKDTVKKLWINRFGAMVFGLMLSFLSTDDRFEGNAVYLATGFLGMFFYCYLIYLVVWEKGAKDRIIADTGRIKKDYSTGFRIALVEAIPAFFVVFLYGLTLILVKGAGVENGFVAGTLTVSRILSLVLQAPYLGFELGFAEKLTYTDVLFWAVSTIPAILTCGFAYILGFNGKLMSRAYKKKKKAE